MTTDQIIARLQELTVTVKLNALNSHYWHANLEDHLQALEAAIERLQDGAFVTVAKQIAAEV